MASNWMIYGANGYTGQLVAQAAKARGHNPVIAGRNQAKIEKLALELDLDYMVFDLADVNTIATAIADLDLVYHAAGPFIETSEPMVKACLATNTHYLDITGEIDVFEKVFTYDEVARKNRIALIPGVGFDVVPTDCLAKHVSDQLPQATSLEIAFAGISRTSGGTSRTAVNMLPKGGRIRRNGVLQSHPLGSDKRRVRFMHGYYDALPIPWGDLATAYRTTAIPNITTSMVFPTVITRLAGGVSSPIQSLMSRKRIHRLVSFLAGKLMHGPNASLRQMGRSYIWAKAIADNGQAVEAWLDTLEAYQFTAEASLLAIEHTLQLNPVGALTPALAFGKDFVLEIPNTRRLDKLDVGNWQVLV